MILFFVWLSRGSDSGTGQQGNTLCDRADVTYISDVLGLDPAAVRH